MLGQSIKQFSRYGKLRIIKMPIHYMFQQAVHLAGTRTNGIKQVAVYQQ